MMSSGRKPFYSTGSWSLPFESKVQISISPVVSLTSAPSPNRPTLMVEALFVVTASHERLWKMLISDLVKDNMPIMKSEPLETFQSHDRRQILGVKDFNILRVEKWHTCSSKLIDQHSIGSSVFPRCLILPYGLFYFVLTFFSRRVIWGECREDRSVMLSFSQTITIDHHESNYVFSGEWILLLYFPYRPDWRVTHCSEESWEFIYVLHARFQRSFSLGKEGALVFISWKTNDSRIKRSSGKLWMRLMVLPKEAFSKQKPSSNSLSK